MINNIKHRSSFKKQTLMDDILNLKTKTQKNKNIIKYLK